MPNLTGDVYAPVMPMWFVNGLRLFTLFFSLGLAWLSYHDWSNMPIFARVIVAVLAPVFFLSALSAKKWWATFAVNPFFLADHLGMYFRRNDSFMHYIVNKNKHQKNGLKQWLFEPWQHINHVRVAKVNTSDGYTDGAVLMSMQVMKRCSRFLMPIFKIKSQYKLVWKRSVFILISRLPLKKWWRACNQCIFSTIVLLVTCPISK